MTYAPNSPDTLTSRWLFGTGLFALLASGALVGLGLSWVLGTGTNALDQHGVMFAESLVPFGHEGAGAVFLGGSLAAFVAGCWLLATRTTPSRRVHADIPTWVGGLGICAVLVVIDQSPLVVIGYLPFTLLAPLFGFDEVDIGALASYPLLLQWLLLLIACAIAGMVYQRHRPRLQGLTAPVTEAERQRSLARATTRTNRWTKVAMESPLVYALSRILMFCCVPGFRFAGFGDPILYAGLGLAFMATMGAWLTCGLIRPWGEVFPRWMIGLRGRRVPIRLAVIAGLLVAVMLAATCKGLIVQGLSDQQAAADIVVAHPLIGLPMLLWPLWVVALAIATISYGVRRAIAESTPTDRLTGDPAKVASPHATGSAAPSCPEHTATV